MVKTIVLIITVGKREFKGRAKAAVFSCQLPFNGYNGEDSRDYYKIIMFLVMVALMILMAVMRTMMMLMMLAVMVMAMMVRRTLGGWGVRVAGGDSSSLMAA